MEQESPMMETQRVPPFRRSGRFLLPAAMVLLAAAAGVAHRVPDRVGIVPVFAFPVGHAVNVFWLPRDRIFVYYGNGDYFRWQTNRWTVAPLASGPWQPPQAAGVVIPHALTFGPPPPIEADAAYFAWWRGTVADWWQIHHPRWWTAFGSALGQYRTWQAQVLPRLRAHPRFWHLAGGLRLRPVFASGQVVIQPSQIQSRILTPDLSGRYYRNARRAYEWSHSWAVPGSYGFEADPGWPGMDPYPVFWGGSVEIQGGGYGGPFPFGVWGGFPYPIFFGGFFRR